MVKKNPAQTVVALALISALVFLLNLPAVNGQDTASVPLVSGMQTIWLPGKLPADATTSSIPVDIYLPPEGTIVKGDVLMLPGWNFSRMRWYKETKLLAFADQYGFRLVFPEMLKSVYESAYYPETWLKWAETPGGEWLRTILLPEISSRYGLLAPGGNNFVFGLSTGGRGAALVPLQNPGLFVAGASLSGDFDQTLFPEDKLMAAVYGMFVLYGDRWKSIDNPRTAAMKGLWGIPFYFGHGLADTVVPYLQTVTMYKTVSTKYPKLKFVIHLKEKEGHTFAYWGSEIEAVFTFFTGLLH